MDFINKEEDSYSYETCNKVAIIQCGIGLCSSNWMVTNI